MRLNWHIWPTVLGLGLKFCILLRWLHQIFISVMHMATSIFFEEGNWFFLITNSFFKIAKCPEKPGSAKSLYTSTYLEKAGYRYSIPYILVCITILIPSQIPTILHTETFSLKVFVYWIHTISIRYILKALMCCEAFRAVCPQSTTTRV